MEEESDCYQNKVSRIGVSERPNSRHKSLKTGDSWMLLQEKVQQKQNEMEANSGRWGKEIWGGQMV